MNKGLFGDSLGRDLEDWFREWRCVHMWLLTMSCKLGAVDLIYMCCDVRGIVCLC